MEGAVVPQWKKDLIARLRNQNKPAGEEQLCPPRHSAAAETTACGQQPDRSRAPAPTSSTSAAAAAGRCSSSSSAQQKTHQEQTWQAPKDGSMVANGDYNKSSDSDSSEDLHYGPGIVSRLKNKYLSLAHRDTHQKRPSILHMRKATSLENILDDDAPKNRIFLHKLNGDANHLPNRYRTPGRGVEMKRARSVEAISRSHHDDEVLVKPERKSLHEDMLIAEGSDKPYDKKPVETTNENNKYSGRVNRPKRIQPIMNEREKPPVDAVKQMKMIFERRPESRTKPPITTGDVAAKVDTYNKIIVKEKAQKKPAIKHKPVITTVEKKARQPKTVYISQPEENQNGHTKKPNQLELNHKVTPSFDHKLISPIPDVSLIEPLSPKNEDKLSETPDLILTSSPINSSPSLKKSTEHFIKEEIRNSTPLVNNKIFDDVPDSPGYKKVSPTSLNNITKASGTAIFNFQNNQTNTDQSHLPVNKNISEQKTPPSQPLKIDVQNGHQQKQPEAKQKQPEVKQKQQEAKQPPKPQQRTSVGSQQQQPKSGLTLTEIEKNKINVARSSPSTPPPAPPQQSVSASAEVTASKLVVPKAAKRSTATEQATTAVFNFTGRKEVPDYIANDTTRTPGRPDLPKTGEGGIILVPGATISNSFLDETDHDEEEQLRRPPSPCDVEFLNDNVLIGGKSSLSIKSKRVKQLNISFVEAGPEIFEYPSESSLLIEDLPSPISNSTLGHSVPNLTGSTLANYTPRSTEDFQLGVTRPVQQPIVSAQAQEPESDQSEEPKAFSAGANSDILF